MYQYPCRTVFPVVSQTIAATPPLRVHKIAYRSPKTDLTRGVSQKNLASEAYRAIGGVARNSTLLLLNGLNKAKEVIAPLFKIRKLGLRPLETPCFLGQSSPTALPSTSLNEEVGASLSYLSRLAATGYRQSRYSGTLSDTETNP